VLSASAVDPECGFMVHDRAEAEMSAAMAAIADIRIMAVDGSKWGRRALVAVDRLREGDIVVSDGLPTRDYCSLLEGLHLVDASPGATERAVYARPTEQAGLGQRVGSGEEDHW
jgi:DeoR family glycerol-3-phosphate regulon repressor